MFGQFDPARMQQIVGTFGPILRSQGTMGQIPDPAPLCADEFIDPSIRMG